MEQPAPDPGGALDARRRWRRWWLALLALPWQRRAPHPPRLSSARPLRVLAIRPDHLGDLLLATPALALLRTACPAAEITALVGPWARPVLDGRTEVDVVRTCAFPGFARGQPVGGLARLPHTPLAPYAQLLYEALRLRQTRYDVALVLRVDHWWGAALAAYAGIPVRLGYAVPESRPFLTHALPPDFAQHSVWENWRVVTALLALLGRPVPLAEPPPVRATVPPAGRAQAAALLAAHGVPAGARLLAIHPGTGAAVKHWSVPGWAAVADALATRLAAQVVVTGSTEERTLVNAVVAAMRQPAIAAAGQLDWHGLAGLFARCAVVLGVDSGPLHLAAALGVPTVHLFGPTAPARFGPWGLGPRHRVVRAGLACSPCGNLLRPPCGELVEPACMRALQPEQVVAAALAALAAPEEAEVPA
ncbi:MAG TPA: glycosyltransferase family 9 protein [Chloroflexota bacterium]|nr:glycosyltransferase family 9 protein [Chloroflexota bacterium]